MKRASLQLFAAIAVAVATAISTAPAARAADVIAEWAIVKAPSPPTLKPATVDPKTDALLVVDMVKQACNAKARPRCVATIPAIENLLNEARAKNVTVIYTLGTAGKDFVDELAPKGGEPIVKSGADKFIKTDLEKILKDRGISGLIVVGTLAAGGVLHTASAAALHGFKVVVPVDGMSSPNENTLFTEQYTAWHLANAPVFGGRVTLTRTGMIKF